jgi:hypothetical protein
MKREKNITRSAYSKTHGGRACFRRATEAGNERGVSNRSRALGLALLGASWVGLARPARAAELVASGPAQCPDTAELAFLVERALGTPLAAAAPLRLRVLFEVAGGAGYRARLAVESPGAALPGSERALNARECGPLGDAVAVAIALALSASEERREESPSSEPAAREESARAPSESDAIGEPASRNEPSRSAAGALEQAAPGDERAPGEGATFTPALALSAVGDLGSLPGAGVGIGLGAELGWERLALRAMGTLFLDRHVALPGAGETGLGADMGLALGALSVCSTLLRAARGAAVFVCVGWELGRLQAIGTGVRAPRHGGALWSAPRVDAGLDWAAGEGPLRLVAQVTAVAPLERDDFYLRDLGTVHRPPAVAGRLSLGVHVDFR